MSRKDISTKLVELFLNDIYFLNVCANGTEVPRAAAIIPNQTHEQWNSLLNRGAPVLKDFHTLQFHLLVFCVWNASRHWHYEELCFPTAQHSHIRKRDGSLSYN